MKRILLSLLVALAVLAPALAQKPSALRMPIRPPEPGATPGVELTNISNVTRDKGTSVFPMVVVSRNNPNLVAVAWRRFALPGAASDEEQSPLCAVSLSKDGGKTFRVTNMFPYLRVDGDGSPEHPSLIVCNAPFAAIANDGTLYAGASTTGPNTPPQGRLGVVVSHDGGTRWSKSVFGLTMDRFAPGLKGLNGGTAVTDAPWDGANGVVDPQTGTFYAATRGHISASHDKGKTFGTVYAAYGTASAAFGTLVSAMTETSFKDGKCPCLVVSISSDEGKTWSRNLVAQSADYSAQGTVRYPIAAANPAKKGSYAVGVYAPDHKSVKVYYTADYGKSWKSASPQPLPASSTPAAQDWRGDVLPHIAFTTVNQVDAGYTTDGRILVTWRAWRNVAAHNTFVAMMTGETFGPTVKVTPELSIDPPMTFATFYIGDFTNWVQGTNTDAFVAFVFAPKGVKQDTWLARVPLSLLDARAADAEAPPTASLPTSVTRPPAGKGAPRLATPVDLAAFGYVEEEFFVTGKANVYQYDPAGAVVVKTPHMDYTTRILVRRPADSRRFSGIVRVETSHPQHGIDFVWPRVADYVLANGDALVSITTRRGKASAIEHLKKFDSVRYAPINFTEDGLNWDVIGQVGRLLKTKNAANPLNAYDVKRLYAQGWSGGGALLLIYISDGFHTWVRMPGGGPIFDGYLVGEPSGYPKINSTAAARPNTDARQKVQAIDVPAISLHTRAQESYRRRPDSDRPNDRYRVYEVAGAVHNNIRLPRISKQSEEVFRRSGCVRETSRFPMHHFFKSALARLDAWAARGVTPPPSQRIALNADGAPMLDVHGNPVGGVRSSYLDVPAARYSANAPVGDNAACSMDGAQERFPREKLASLYRNHAGYVNSVVRRVSELERDGWLLPADGKELREEAAQFDGI